MSGRVIRPADVFATTRGRSVVVGGRITAMRPHGALCFWDLTWDGSTLQLVGPGSTPLRRLDVAAVQGVVVESAGRVELQVEQVQWRRTSQDRCRSDVLPLLDPIRPAALRVRAELERAARTELDGRGFVPVRSPGIVGNWVEGQTGAFALDYYGRTAYLTLSNMLCHQILLGSGLGDIYEIGPIYRAENPSSRRRLAEFTILDVGMAFADLADLIDIVEGTIGAMCVALRDLRAEAEVSDGAGPFPRVAYSCVLEEIGLRATTGSQLPAAARRFLADRFPGFVWVMGFPAHTRPFFVRAENGTCFDAQLWYCGKTYLAAGGERETSPDEIVRRIEAEGKEVRRYEFFLEYLRSGLPPSVGMGMGIERFLAAVLGGTAADFAAFPGAVGTIESTGRAGRQR